MTSKLPRENFSELIERESERDRERENQAKKERKLSLGYANLATH
jgi:hypothetical protein